jgi:pimeloyl-ACP methyl ester carboxylesterase
VIGHSEGGETAPILACERPLAGIVLMAAPGRSLFDILREQKTQALAGMPPKFVESELAEHARALELLCKDGAGDASQLRADYRGEWANRAWYRSHAKHDPIAQIRQVKCPVLIVQGAKDLQVSAERDVPPLQKALADAKNGDVTVKVLPGLDHLFKKVLGDPPSFQEYFQARPVDGGFLDLLVAWLKERAAR